MFQFTLGVITGIYIATYYDCKPIIEKCTEFIDDCMPKKKI